MIYLLTNKHVIKLGKSQYSGFFTIIGSEVPLFHILGQALKEGGKYKIAPPMDCTTAFQLTEGVAEFDEFYAAWLNGAAHWYRGFNCSHFAYPEIRKGLLLSEGFEDIPTFTMDNDQKTRWLPGCWDRALCEGVSISGTDQPTAALSVAESSYPIPVAIAVHVTLGINIPVPIAWMNPGEQLIRGPMGEGSGQGTFDVCSMVWFRKRNPEITRWNLSCEFLPPERPYNPTEDQIQKWWAGCEEWRQKITKVGGLVFVKRLKGA
jgi:hypothetical protein